MSNTEYTILGEIKFECQVSIRPGQSIYDKVNWIIDAMNSAKSAKLRLVDDDSNVAIIGINIVEAESVDVG